MAVAEGGGVGEVDERQPGAWRSRRPRGSRRSSPARTGLRPGRRRLAGGRVGRRGDALRPPPRRPHVLAVPPEALDRRRGGDPDGARATVQVVEHAGAARPGRPAAPPARRPRRRGRRRAAGAGPGASGAGVVHGDSLTDPGNWHHAARARQPTSWWSVPLSCGTDACWRPVARTRRRPPGGGSSRAARSSRGSRREDAVVREVREELGCEVARDRDAGRAPSRSSRATRCGSRWPSWSTGSRCRTSTTRCAGSVPRSSTRSTGWRPTCRSSTSCASCCSTATGSRAATSAARSASAGPCAGRPGRGRRRCTGCSTGCARGCGAPEVLGTDARGREVLTYLPGAIVDVDDELLTDAQLVDLAGWTRELHDASDGFDGDGPVAVVRRSTARTGRAQRRRAVQRGASTATGVVGVFDWDLAGPTTRLFELAHLAWTGVPLFREPRRRGRAAAGADGRRRTAAA